jgi:hypothetical protein
MKMCTIVFIFEMMFICIGSINLVTLDYALFQFGYCAPSVFCIDSVSVSMARQNINTSTVNPISGGVCSCIAL